jgi:hypothetical protein
MNDDNDKASMILSYSECKVSGVEIDIKGNDVSIVSGDTTPSC